MRVLLCTVLTLLAACDGARRPGGSSPHAPDGGAALDRSEDALLEPEDAGDGGAPAEDGGDPGPDLDSAPTDAGDVPTDAGDMPTDAGDPPTDAGLVPADVGMASTDAGFVPADVGIMPSDAGAAPVDAGIASPDAGVPPFDAGLFDGGPPPVFSMLSNTALELRDLGNGRVLVTASTQLSFTFQPSAATVTLSAVRITDLNGSVSEDLLPLQTSINVPPPNTPTRQNVELAPAQTVGPSILSLCGGPAVVSLVFGTPGVLGGPDLVTPNCN